MASFETNGQSDNRPLVGIGLKVLATFLFSIMVALVKYASSFAPTGEIVFARSFFALIPLLIMALMRGNFADCFATTYPWRHVVRCIVGISAMFSWFLVLSILPLPEATAISFAAPLLVVIFAAVFLKEKVRAYRWTAVIVGLVGVMIILWPRLTSSSDGVVGYGIFLALFSTVLIAVASILIRRMTKTEKNASIVFYFAISGAAFSSVSLYWGWIIPDWKLAMVLISAGLIGGVAQIVMTQAFRCAEASLLAPFDYFNVIWVLMLGIYVFEEYPSRSVIVGGSIVVMAGLFIIYRENRIARNRAIDRKIKTT